MFRLTKTDYQSGKTEILRTSEDEELMLDALCDHVRDNFSNGDEFSCGDFEAIRDERREGCGAYEIKVDEVDALSDEEIVDIGGGVCSHCHSTDVDCEEPVFDEDARITREVVCNVCGNSTIEKYALVGLDR